MIAFTNNEIDILWILGIIILTPLGIWINRKLQKRLDKFKSNYKQMTKVTDGISRGNDKHE